MSSPKVLMNTESTDIPRSITADVKTGGMSSGCSIMGMLASASVVYAPCRKMLC